jgi:hypothetical protein
MHVLAVALQLVFLTSAWATTDQVFVSCTGCPTVPANLSNCLTAAVAQLTLPSSAGYYATRQLYNLEFQHYPLAFARVSSTSEIQKVLACGR